MRAATAGVATGAAASFGFLIVVTASALPLGGAAVVAAVSAGFVAGSGALKRDGGAAAAVVVAGAVVAGLKRLGVVAAAAAVVAGGFASSDVAFSPANRDGAVDAAVVVAGAVDGPKKEKVGGFVTPTSAFAASVVVAAAVVVAVNVGVAPASEKPANPDGLDVVPESVSAGFVAASPLNSDGVVLVVAAGNLKAEVVDGAEVAAEKALVVENKVGADVVGNREDVVAAGALVAAVSGGLANSDGVAEAVVAVPNPPNADPPAAPLVDRDGVDAVVDASLASEKPPKLGALDTLDESAEVVGAEAVVAGVPNENPLVDGCEALVAKPKPETPDAAEVAAPNRLGAAVVAVVAGAATAGCPNNVVCVAGVGGPKAPKVRAGARLR